MKIYRLILKLFILSIFVINISSSLAMNGLCPVPYYRRPQPPQECDWERSDRRCNDDSECCPGKRCTAFNYCEIAT